MTRESHPLIRELLTGLRELLDPWLAQLRATIISNQSTNERGAHRVSCPVAAAPTGAQPTLVANELKGYSFRETTGNTTALIVLRDGADATGDIVVEIALQANESVRDWFGETGISVIDGLYVDRVSGSTEGAVWLRSGGR